MTTMVFLAFLNSVGLCVQPLAALSNMLCGVGSGAGLSSIGPAIFIAIKGCFMNASYIFTTCGSLGLVLVECLGG